MLKLTKGDEGNLEGRVTVYAICNCQKNQCTGTPNSCPGSQIFALYVATNPTDFAEKTGAPLEKLNEIPQKIKSELKSYIGDIKSHIDECVKKFNLEPYGEMFQKLIDEKLTDKVVDRVLNNFNPLYATPIRVDSELELARVPENVLFAGEYTSPIICLKAVKMGIDFYMLDFDEQTKKKLGVEFSNGKEEKARQSSLTYKEITGAAIKGYIVDSYLTPIFDGKKYGDEAKIAAARKGLVRFGAGAPFALDIAELCELTDKNSSYDGKCGNIIDLVLDKIVAVHTEAFLEAAKLRDRIKALKESH